MRRGTAFCIHYHCHQWLGQWGYGIQQWSPCADTLTLSCDSSKPIDGFVDDYAFVIRGLLDLYEASLDERWLKWCHSLQTRQDQLFWDEEGGGYYSSQDGDASIVLRMKEGVLIILIITGNLESTFRGSECFMMWCNNNSNNNNREFRERFQRLKVLYDVKKNLTVQIPIYTNQ